MRNLISTLLILTASTTAAQAFEVTGGEVELAYSAFTDDSDFAKTALQGAVELGFNQRFGMQIDLGLHGFNGISDTATNLTLHGLYHVSDQTSIGLFYGQERLDGESVSLLGFEAGQEAAKFDGEVFVAIGEEEDLTVRLMGLSGRYAVSDKFGLGGSLQRADLEGGLDITRLGVKADMALGQSTSAFIEVGSLSGSIDGSSGSETFVGIGADLKFGAARGATFGKRGLFQMIPGL